MINRIFLALLILIILYSFGIPLFSFTYYSIFYRVNENDPQSFLISSSISTNHPSIQFQDLQIQISNKNYNSPRYQYILSATAENPLDKPQQIGFEIYTKSMGWLSGSYGIAKSIIIPASGIRTFDISFSLYPAQAYSIKLDFADMSANLPWKEERMPFLPASATIFYSTTINLTSGDLQGL